MTKEELKEPTKRAIRMGGKKEMKSKNRFCGNGISESQNDLARKIASMKPGGRGRISKALADPYGCHEVNEL